MDIGRRRKACIYSGLSILACVICGSLALAQDRSAAARAKPLPPRWEEGGFDVTRFGAKGDGVTDDTEKLQRALAHCSNADLSCEIPANRTFLVTEPLFVWGGASLIGPPDRSSTLVFRAGNEPYLLNVGISGPRKPERPFTGTIANVSFRVSEGRGGRLIYFWRTRNATVADNVFDFGAFAYSATSSGNNEAWLRSGFRNAIRENIRILRNRIVATATNKGSEGIGLEHFHGAVITENEISGVGDDPIGIHYSSDIQILRNELESVDGRIFVANSRNVEVAYNTHRRIRAANGAFYPGIALLYVGFESYRNPQWEAPGDISLHDNTLVYSAGSIDKGAAIYLYAPRRATVERNQVVNESASVTASALHLLPAKFTGRWTDPEGEDPPDTARVWRVHINGNSSKGPHPLPFRMTGMCEDYRGPVDVSENTAPRFNFYCDKVSSKGNREF